MAEQLRGASHTLECLELYLSCMGLCDGEFVDLCSMGLASLHALRHVNLDVSHNVPLTTVGVNAIQTALRPSVRCLELSLEGNQHIPHVELHHATGLRSVTLHLAGTHVVTLQVAHNVTDITADLREIWPGTSSSSVVDHRLLAGAWVHAGVRRLNLTLDPNSMALLGEILTPHGPLVDLYLETVDHALSPQLWNAVRVLGTTGRLRTLQLLHCENHEASILPLPRGLLACHHLITLQLDMMYAMPSTWLAFVIRTVAHDLMNLELFHLALCAVHTDVCDEMIAPCTEFGRGDRPLKTLYFDFHGCRLTDASTALLATMAVERHRHGKYSTVKLQGSSVGEHGLQALSACAALSRCNFHFYPPMTDELSHIHTACSVCLHSVY